MEQRASGATDVLETVVCRARVLYDARGHRYIETRLLDTHDNGIHSRTIAELERKNLSVAITDRERLARTAAALRRTTPDPPAQDQTSLDI